MKCLTGRKAVEVKAFDEDAIVVHEVDGSLHEMVGVDEVSDQRTVVSVAITCEKETRTCNCQGNCTCTYMYMYCICTRLCSRSRT